MTYVRDISLQKASFYIESDYTINIAFFGSLNVEGYSYGRLKREVEALITKNYPDSLPQVAITTPGFFMVYVKGEVAEAIDVPAWGFMKLSSVLKDLLTPYSSERRVEIRNGKEESRFYDLFRSRRLGEREQDPFLKNGDTIILHRYDRKIKVDGEVHNPGIFELLPEEDLTILIEEYAKGMTPMADRSRVELTRYLSSSAEYGETLYLDFSKERFPVGFSLANMDIIKIPKKLDHQPLVFFQGAVGTSDNGTTVSNKLPLPITEGERLSFATRRIEDQFTLVSDLEKVLLARADLEEPLRINLQELLLKGNSREDPILQDGDIIVVPFQAVQGLRGRSGKKSRTIPLYSQQNLGVLYWPIRRIQVERTSGNQGKNHRCLRKKNTIKRIALSSPRMFSTHH